MKKNILHTFFVILCALFFSSCSNGILENPDLDTFLPVEFTESDSPEIPLILNMTPAEIFENNADAVFTIYTSYDNYYFNSSGSGFFIREDGLAVTNHHVIVGWPYANVRTHSGLNFDILGYYLYDESNDLVIIQINGNRFPYLIMGDSDSLRIGDNIYTIGSPLGYHNTFSTGIISRFDMEQEVETGREIIQHLIGEYLII